jgi:hypothetical protein
MQAGVKLFFFFALLLIDPVSALAHSGDATGFASIQVQGQIVRYTLKPAPTLKIDSAKLADTINKKINVFSYILFLSRMSYTFTKSFYSSLKL